MTEVETSTVIAVGDGAIAALNIVAREALHNVQCVALTTSSQSTIDPAVHATVLLGGGMGAGGDPRLGRRAAGGDHAALNEILFAADEIILLAAFGGGTGTGIMPLLVDRCTAIMVPTYAIIGMPFTWEGLDRRRMADEALEYVQHQVDDLAVIENDALLQRLPQPRVPDMEQAFALSTRTLAWHVLAALCG